MPGAVSLTLPPLSIIPVYEIDEIIQVLIHILADEMFPADEILLIYEKGLERVLSVWFRILEPPPSGIHSWSVQCTDSTVPAIG
jgi:hypothetical protein